MKRPGFYFGPAALALLAVSACGKDERLALCDLPPDPGTKPCSRAPRFYYAYDATENTCKRLTYSGCGGHQHRFWSRNPCERRCVAHCGDGHLERAEECDDGNDQSGDGCSAECTLEGAVAIDGGVEPNVCPRIESYSVGPLETAVGSSITLSAAVVDPEGDPWSLSWTASTGSVVASSDSLQAEYQCTVAGQHTLTLSLAGSANCEAETKQIEVRCVP
jgi:cysteine-rich repeat protein